MWIVKAHHPGVMKGAIEFDSHKVITCIRNPIDVIVSYATLCNTMSHSAQPEYSYPNDFPEWWDWWIKDCSHDHAKYFKTLFKNCVEEKQNPIYIVRFEDLLNNKKGEFEGLARFLLDMESLEGTNAQRRID